MSAKPHAISVKLFAAILTLGFLSWGIWSFVTLHVSPRKNIALVPGETLSILLTSYSETDLPQKPITGYLSEDYFSNGKLVFPKGTKLYGILGPTHNEKRATVLFNQAITRDGKVVPVSVIGCDPDGSVGVKGLFTPATGGYPSFVSIEPGTLVKGLITQFKEKNEHTIE